MSAAAPSGDLATAAAAFLHSNGGQPCKLSTLRRHLLDAALGGSEQQQQAWLKTFLCQNSGRFAVDAKGHVRLSDISMAFDSEPEPEPEPGPEPAPEPGPELGMELGDLATAAVMFLRGNGGQPCKLSTLRRHLLGAAVDGSGQPQPQQQQMVKLKAILSQYSELFEVDPKGRVTLVGPPMALASGSEKSVKPAQPEVREAQPKQSEAPTCAARKKSSAGTVGAQRQQSQQPQRLQGHRPNLWWRAVSTEQLRSAAYPEFWGLPPPNTLKFSPRAPATWRHLRQDSYLWQALHRGILTSRNTPAFLGLLEPKAAKFVGAHARVGAQRHVVEELREAAEWRTEQRAAGESSGAGGEVCMGMADAVWAQLGLPDTAATEAELLRANREQCDTYVRQMLAQARAQAQEGTEEEEEQAGREWHQRGGVSSLRMSFGTIQEGTALAAYLSHLTQKCNDDRTPQTQQVAAAAAAPVLREVGLLMLEPWHGLPEGCVRHLPPEFDPAMLPAVGASPDAMMRCTNPEEEVEEGGQQVKAEGAGERLRTKWIPVEVKCICPWSDAVSSYGQSHARARRFGRFFLNNSTPHNELPVHAVVQTQLEMLASGSRTGVLLSYTATHGMHVLRLRRNDEYCAALLWQLARVHSRYVLGVGGAQNDCRRETLPLPARDEGFKSDAAFMKFLRLTKALRKSSITVDALVPTPATPSNSAGPALFLDDSGVDGGIDPATGTHRDHAQKQKQNQKQRQKQKQKRNRKKIQGSQPREPTTSEIEAQWGAWYEAQQHNPAQLAQRKATAHALVSSATSSAKATKIKPRAETSMHSCMSIDSPAFVPPVS